MEDGKASPRRRGLGTVNLPSKQPHTIQTRRRTRRRGHTPRSGHRRTVRPSVKDMQVKLDPSASSDEVEAVRAVLRSSGISDAEVRALPATRGVGNGSTWMTWILASAPLNVFLTTLGKRIAEQLAEEGTGPAIRDFFARLRASRQDNPHPEGLISIIDPDSLVVLIQDWPIEAYERLLEIDWSRQKPATYKWDPELSEWVDSA